MAAEAWDVGGTDKRPAVTRRYNRVTVPQFHGRWGRGQRKHGRSLSWSPIYHAGVFANRLILLQRKKTMTTSKHKQTRKRENTTARNKKKWFLGEIRFPHWPCVSVLVSNLLLHLCVCQSLQQRAPLVSVTCVSNGYFHRGQRILAEKQHTRKTLKESKEGWKH